MMLKMAVEAPMPRARVMVAMIAKEGLLRRLRRAKRISWPSVPIMLAPAYCERLEEIRTRAPKCFYLLLRSGGARTETAAEAGAQKAGEFLSYEKMFAVKKTDPPRHEAGRLCTYRRYCEARLSPR